MQTLNNATAGDIVLAMADRIVENRAYLSEIDGKIGDGDHGVNMAKGFNMAAERLKGKNEALAASLDTLGTVLMTEIGGSMGPLYGVMFTEFAEKSMGSTISMPLLSAVCFMPDWRAFSPSVLPRLVTKPCWIRLCQRSKPSMKPLLPENLCRGTRSSGCCR